MYGGVHDDQRTGAAESGWSMVRNGFRIHDILQRDKVGQRDATARQATAGQWQRVERVRISAHLQVPAAQRCKAKVMYNGFVIEEGAVLPSFIDSKNIQTHTIRKEIRLKLPRERIS